MHADCVPQGFGLVPAALIYLLRSVLLSLAGIKRLFVA